MIINNVPGDNTNYQGIELGSSLNTSAFSMSITARKLTLGYYPDHPTYTHLKKFIPLIGPIANQTRDLLV